MISDLALKKRGFVALIFFVVFSLIYFSDAILKNYTILGNYDNSIQSYAWFQFLSKMMAIGRIPLWDPNVFSGHSFIGEIQTGVFYPPNLVFFSLFGNLEGVQERVILWLVIAHFIGAGYFMFLLCRSMHNDFSASLTGGIVFSFIGHLAYRAPGQLNIYFGLIWAPLVLMYFKKSLEENRPFFLAMSGAFLSLSLLAGHFQPFIHDIMIISLWSLLSLFKRKGCDLATFLKIAKSLLIAISSGVGFAAIQIFATIEYSLRSYRWVGAAEPVLGISKVPYEFASSIYLPIEALKDFLHPGFVAVQDGGNPYFGIFALIFALYAVFFATKRSWRYLIIGGFGLLCALGPQNPFYYLIYNIIPFADKIRSPVRYIYLLHFATAILTAIGLNELRIRLRIKHSRQVLLALILVTAILSDAINTRNDQWMFLPVSGAPYSPSVYYERNPIIDTLEKEYPYFRTLNYKDALPPNIGDVYKIQTTGGHGATMPKDYFDFLSLDWRPSSQIYDLLNVKYVVSRERLSELKLVQTFDSIYLYERPNPLPKAWVPEKIIYVADHQEAKELLTSMLSSAQDLHRTALLEDLGTRRTVAYENTSMVEISLDTYDADTIQILVKSPISCVLVVSEIHYPGWKAFIDGTETPVYTANYVLRAVELPVGNHKIRFQYDPLSVKIGLLITILTMIAVCILYARRSPNSRDRSLIWSTGLTSAN